MDTNEFLEMHKTIKHHGEYSFRGLAPRMWLADDTTLSVQASHTHYCTPRDDNPEYFYEVEIGYPSIPLPDYLMEYAEDPEKPTKTVYGYVPVSKLDRFIQEHGGIVGTETYAKQEDGTIATVKTKF